MSCIRKIKTFVRLLRSEPKKIYQVLVSNFAKSSVSHLFPDRFFLKIQYKSVFGRRLDLKEPKTFTEKLNWLKLYDRNPEYCKIVDKYEVRKYIAQQLGEEYLIPLLGVWDRVEDIDFDKLPEQFVLKCTHDSGSVVLCSGKNCFDYNAAKIKLAAKLKSNLFWHGREWPYKDLKPRIIAEQYMENEDGEDLIDYKFFCFNGKPEFVYVSQGLSNHETARLCYMWLDWTPTPFRRTDFDLFETLPPRPKRFDQMLEAAKLLSRDYPFARVDFYEINGQLYFGEITFYPGAGFTAFEPEEWDYKLGKLLEIPVNKFEKSR